MYKSGANTVYVNTWTPYIGANKIYSVNGDWYIDITGKAYLHGVDINGNDFLTQHKDNPNSSSDPDNLETRTIKITNAIVDAGFGTGGISLNDLTFIPQTITETQTVDIQFTESHNTVDVDGKIVKGILKIEANNEQSITKIISMTAVGVYDKGWNEGLTSATVSDLGVTKKDGANPQYYNVTTGGVKRWLIPVTIFGRVTGKKADNTNYQSGYYYGSDTTTLDFTTIYNDIIENSGSSRTITNLSWAGNDYTKVNASFDKGDLQNNIDLPMVGDKTLYSYAYGLGANDAKANHITWTPITPASYSNIIATHGDVQTYGNSNNKYIQVQFTLTADHLTTNNESTYPYTIPNNDIAPATFNVDVTDLVNSGGAISALKIYTPDDNDNPNMPRYNSEKYFTIETNGNADNFIRIFYEYDSNKYYIYSALNSKSYGNLHALFQLPRSSSSSGIDINDVRLSITQASNASDSYDTGVIMTSGDLTYDSTNDRLIGYANAFLDTGTNTEQVSKRVKITMSASKKPSSGSVSHSITKATGNDWTNTTKQYNFTVNNADAGCVRLYVNGNDIMGAYANSKTELYSYEKLFTISGSSGGSWNEEIKQSWDDLYSELNFENNVSYSNGVLSGYVLISHGSASNCYLVKMGTSNVPSSSDGSPRTGTVEWTTANGSILTGEDYKLNAYSASFTENGHYSTIYCKIHYSDDTYSDVQEFNVNTYNAYHKGFTVGSGDVLIDEPSYTIQQSTNESSNISKKYYVKNGDTNIGYFTIYKFDGKVHCGYYADNMAQPLDAELFDLTGGSSGGSYSIGAASSTFTENGQFLASDDGLDGWSVINIDVPTGSTSNYGYHKLSFSRYYEPGTGWKWSYSLYIYDTNNNYLDSESGDVTQTN